MAMSGQSNKDYYVTMDCMVDFFFFIILTIKCDIFKSRHGGVKGAVWTGEPGFQSARNGVDGRR